MQVELSRQFASKLVELDIQDVSKSALTAARRCLVDAMGCAAAGKSHPAAVRTASWASVQHLGGGSTVWFSGGMKTSAMAAAMINAASASILDLDDGHRVAAGHPGAAVVPSVLACAEELGSSFEDVLMAIVVGYQAGIEIARLRTPLALETVATGRWSAIAVAAALSRLRNFDLYRFENAMTIAEAYAPNMAAADHAGFRGSDLKEGIPWSVITGFSAVSMAEIGVLGYLAGFSNPKLYDVAKFGSGMESLHVENTYFKRFACCRWLHSAIDASLLLANEMDLKSGIDSIHVSTFGRAASLANQTAPADVISAQFSLPFMVAVAVVKGEEALLQLDEDVLRDAAVLDLARKITWSVEQDYERMYPLKVPARVVFRQGYRQLDRAVISPLGDFDNPLSDSMLLDKFKRLSGADSTVLGHVAKVLSGSCGMSDVLRIVS